MDTDLKTEINAAKAVIGRYYGGIIESGMVCVITSSNWGPGYGFHFEKKGRKVGDIITGDPKSCKMRIEYIIE